MTAYVSSLALVGLPFVRASVFPFGHPTSSLSIKIWREHLKKKKSGWHNGNVVVQLNLSTTVALKQAPVATSILLSKLLAAS